MDISHSTFSSPMLWGKGVRGYKSTLSGCLGERSHLWVLPACKLKQSWKFDFSEAYDNCQCLQFRSSATTSTDTFHGDEHLTAWFKLWTKKRDIKSTEMTYAFRRCRGNKQRSVHVGTALYHFVYQVGLSVAYFFIYILFNSFDYLFGYCKWFLTRKEWNVEACASVYKKKEKS